jgi:hypothetical protein
VIRVLSTGEYVVGDIDETELDADDIAMSLLVLIYALIVRTKVIVVPKEGDENLLV